MWSMNLHGFVIWLHSIVSFVPAALLLVGAALLVVCALGCTCTPCKEKDDLFHREVY